jgi:hypothetical protein
MAPHPFNLGMPTASCVNIWSNSASVIGWPRPQQPSLEMAVEGESELRMALRHVKTGRRCIMRQFNLIAVLRGKGLPTEEAETVLHWLEEVQRGFEDHYEKLLSEGLARNRMGRRGDTLPPVRGWSIVGHSSPNISGDK